MFAIQKRGTPIQVRPRRAAVPAARLDLVVLQAPNCRLTRAFAQQPTLHRSCLLLHSLILLHSLPELRETEPHRVTCPCDLEGRHQGWGRQHPPLMAFVVKVFEDCTYTFVPSVDRELDIGLLAKGQQDAFLAYAQAR